MIFLDTNVVLYAFGYDDDPAKAIIAQGLLTDASISVQVLAEFSSVLSRGNTRRGKSPRPWPEIDTMIAALSTVLGRIVPLDQEDQRRARRIASRSMLGYYDAQMIAVAARAGGTVLLTEDMNHDQAINGLEIHNPFL